MNRKWLYNFEKGGEIFDITTEEYKNAIDSGAWFDSPDKTKPSEVPDKKEEGYTKYSLGRMTEAGRIEAAAKLGINVSNLLRKDQIEAILKAQE